METMKANLPISMITRLSYLGGYLFLSNSKLMGFIDYHQHAKTKEFIPVGVSMSAYFIVQPILIKNRQTGRRIFGGHKEQVLNGFSSRRAKQLFMRRRLGEYRKYFNDSLYDRAKLHDRERDKTLRNLLLQPRQADIFYFALKGNQVNIYSHQKLYKSFSVNLLKFDTSRKSSSGLSYFEKLQRRSRTKRDTREGVSMEERMRLVNSNAELKKAYFKCVFEKHGAHWAYSESMPDYLFVVVYNCDEFLEEIIKEQNLNKRNRNWFYEKQIFKYIIDKLEKSPKRREEAKIITFEIIFNQILSVQIIGENKSALESPSRLRFFKNYRNLIVIISGPLPARSAPGPKKLKLLIKKFDKYNGFLNAYERELDFAECERPYYDILYSFKKNKGREDLEKNRSRRDPFESEPPEGRCLAS